jgi:hypothetical protein
MRQDCSAFHADNAFDLDEYATVMDRSPEWTGAEMAGHDFWLTRNHHGAGFWDRGLGELGRRLTDAANVYGDVYLYAHDGQIYA